MLFQSWLRTLRTAFKLHGKEGKRWQTSRRKQPARYRPHLELLEDRTAPAVLTVTSPADGGVGSLRDTVQIANADASSGISDTINFHPDLAGATILLTQGELGLIGPYDRFAPPGTTGGKITIDGTTPGGPITLSPSYAVQSLF